MTMNTTVTNIFIDEPQMVYPSDQNQFHEPEVFDTDCYGLEGSQEVEVMDSGVFYPDATSGPSDFTVRGNSPPANGNSAIAESDPNN